MQADHEASELPPVCYCGKLAIQRTGVVCVEVRQWVETSLSMHDVINAKKGLLCQHIDVKDAASQG